MGFWFCSKVHHILIEKTDSAHNKPGKTFTATSCEVSFGVDFLPVRNISIPALFLRVPL